MGSVSTIQGLQSPSTYREAAAAQLRSVIGRRGTTARQLAIAIGKEPTFVSKRARAEIPMTTDDIGLFASALGVRPIELIPDWPVAGASGEVSAELIRGLIQGEPRTWAFSGNSVAA